MDTSGPLALWLLTIEVHCLEETHLEPIIPPLTLIYIGNRCKGYSTNIYIPSKTDLTSEIDTSSHDFFVSFNVVFSKYDTIWNME